MTGAELKAARVRLGLSINGLADVLEVENGRTIQRWEAGEREIPGPVRVLLDLLARSARFDLGLGDPARIRTDLVVQGARWLSSAAHEGQLRKFTGEPYIVHPAAVADLVASAPHDDAMLAAAWLHDVPEDTWITIDAITDLFGSDIANLVEWLTKPTYPADMPRGERKRRTINHLAAAPARAQTIKVADILDNTRTVAERDATFAAKYLPEKVAVLAVLTRADPTLLALAKEQLQAYMKPGGSDDARGLEAV